MALNVTDVQGTKVYLVAAGTALTDAASIATAISGGKQIGCLQSIGDITETRNVQEYTCISSDESTKSQGSVTRGNQQIETLFNAGDTAGQQDLIAAWDNKERRIMIIEFNDQITPTTGKPIFYEIFCSGRTFSMPKDGAVMYNATLEQSSAVSIVLAS